tara:strand:+ start:416 stop:736 length:321 start_codon:yes stop_codon:yes gene_type:complete
MSIIETIKEVQTDDKESPTRWVKATFKLNGQDTFKYWLDNVTEQAIRLLQPFAGKEVQLKTGAYIVSVRLAGSQYTDKNGNLVPRKSTSIELRPSNREYVTDVSSM